jgi:hypothetical protein
MQVVVEVPVDHGHPDSAWSNIRKTVFAWSDQDFPFTTKTGHRLRLEQRLVVRVVGRAFYDAVHGKKSTPNRRKDNPRLTVWEIHPVMRLVVIGRGPENTRAVSCKSPGRKHCSVLKWPSGQSVSPLGQPRGVDSSRLSRFMRGARDFTLAATTRLCEVLGLQFVKPGPTAGRPARSVPSATPSTTPAGQLARQEPKAANKLRGRAPKKGT